MNSRVFCVIVLVSLVPRALFMCFEPSYRTSQYHIEQYTTAPFILVGRVLATEQNRTHQSVKLNVTCIYKAPSDKRETMLHQEIHFTMEHRRICEPPLRTNQSYFFFFEEKEFTRKKKRRRKKKKKNSDDFIRMSQQKKKYISLGAPIPVPEMDIMALERLVEHVKEYKPLGHCYNVWSPWSTCTTKCGVGTMKRTYPRHQEGKPSLVQQAVCHNAPCDVDRRSSDTDYQYQPISMYNCKSMELVRVRWCTGTCTQDAIRTAVSWEMHPTLMICTDHTNQEESLRYHNVAIPSSCGCVRSDAIDQKFAVIETPGSGQPTRSSSKKRNVKKSHGTFVDKVDPPEAPELIRIQGT